MINLYIDFDGVITNTMEVIYTKMRNLNMNPDENEQYTKFMNTTSFAEILSESEFINNSINNIQKIIDSHLFNVHILTHILSLDEAIAKKDYMMNFLPDVEMIFVPKIIEKNDMVDAKGSILIDDYTPNLRRWEKAGGIGVRFSLKMNGKGFRVISHLDDIIEMFRTESEVGSIDTSN